MKRPILFRARRIDNGDWVKGHYFTTPLTDENSGTQPEVGWFFLTGETRHCISRNSVVFVVDPNTVGQFSGLCDKMGNQIFEGDIVIDGKMGRSEVEFFNASFTVSKAHFVIGTKRALQMEVVGTIHDVIQGGVSQSQ